MKMDLMKVVILTCLFLILAVLPPDIHAQSQPLSAVTRFDGVWVVRLDCPSNTESSGAKGYTSDFLAEVKNRSIKGQYKKEGEPGSLTIEGTLKRTAHPLFTSTDIRETRITPSNVFPKVRPIHTGSMRHLRKKTERENGRKAVSATIRSPKNEVSS